MSSSVLLQRRPSDYWAQDFTKGIGLTLQGTNLSHLGKRNNIFKSAFKGDMMFSGGYLGLVIFVTLRTASKGWFSQNFHQHIKGYDGNPWKSCNSKVRRRDPIFCWLKKGLGDSQLKLPVANVLMNHEESTHQFAHQNQTLWCCLVGHSIWKHTHCV